METLINQPAKDGKVLNAVHLDVSRNGAHTKIMVSMVKAMF
jgi:hypothetical protein